MTSKKQHRSETMKNRKKKKSTRILYLVVILGGIFIVLVIFFLILFNALFPPVDSDSLKRKEKQIAIIYFSNKQERFLIPEKRYVVKQESPEKQAKEIVQALLEGSKEGLVNTFPEGVTVKDVKMDSSGTAYVNFSKNLTQLHPGGSTAEMASIYSLTNTLAENVAGVKQVKILIEGSEISSIKGHISTKKAFQPDYELIVKGKEEKS
jgi:cell division protein YceG involved in septum cleavage